MMDDATLERGLRAKPPADPAYRSHLSVTPPAEQAFVNGRVRGRTRQAPTSTWLAILVTVVVVGAGGAALFVVGMGPAPRPVPSPVASPTDEPTRLLPAELPRGLPAGVVDTPLGPARWAHVQGDAAVLPGPSAMLAPGPVGLIAFEPASATLWDSPDAITWSQRRLPPDTVGADQLVFVNDTYWLRAPGRMWRSADTWDWVAVDLPVTGAPGTVVDPGLLAPVASKGVTLFPVEIVPREGATEHRIAVVDGSTVMTVPVPGTPRGSGHLAVVDTTDGFRAFLADDGGILVWESEDGRSWSTSDPLRLGTPIRSVRGYRIYASPDRAGVRADGDDTSWVSEHGDLWESLTSRSDLRIGPGRIDFDFDSSRLSIADADGIWSDVAIRGLSTSPPEDLRTAGASTVRNVLLVSIETWDVPRMRHLWILELEPTSPHP